MRAAVQSALGAAIIILIIVASVQSSATRYDNPLFATPVAASLPMSVFYPVLGTRAPSPWPDSITPTTARSWSTPEVSMFELAPDKTSPFDLPMPSAIGPEMPAREAYGAPTQSAPQVEPSEKALENTQGRVTAYVPLAKIMPKAKTRKNLPHRRSTAHRDDSEAHVYRIAFDAPALAPLAHTRFCFKNPSDCRVHKVIFRGGAIDLTVKRRAELIHINASVNRAIRPEQVNETAATEKWLIAPKSGDCHDYAVTKRHELLQRGWPARALLLAEVVTSWGEHHLVLVVRTRQGDFVGDNLNAAVRPWFKTDYEWVRVESPANPMFWSTIKAPQPAVVAMAGQDRQL